MSDRTVFWGSSVVPRRALSPIRQAKYPRPSTSPGKRHAAQVLKNDSPQLLPRDRKRPQSAAATSPSKVRPRASRPKSSTRTSSRTRPSAPILALPEEESAKPVVLCQVRPELNPDLAVRGSRIGIGGRNCDVRAATTFPLELLSKSYIVQLGSLVPLPTWNPGRVKRVLDLRPWGESVTDAVLCNLAHCCADLRVLDLSGALSVTPSGVAAMLGHLHLLRHLDISETFAPPRLVRWYEVDTILATAVLQSGTNLRSLELRGAPFSDGALGLLARGAPELLHIDLSSCERVTDDGLCRLLVGCRKLEALFCADCPEVRGHCFLTSNAGSGPSGVMILLTSLRELCFARCPKLSDTSLSELSSGCPLLELFDLTGNAQISDDGVCQVAQRCTRLTVLSLAHCGGRAARPQTAKSTGRTGLQRTTQISDRSLFELACCCPYLASIDLSGCAVSDEGLGALASQCSSLSFVAAATPCPQRRNECGKWLLAANDHPLYTQSSQAAVLGGGFGDSELRLPSTASAASTLVGKLVALKLCGTRFLDARYFLAIDNWAELRELDLSECALITDAVVIHLMSRAPALTHLELARCPLLGEDSVRAIANSAQCAQLLVLDLSRFSPDVLRSSFGSKAVSDVRNGKHVVGSSASVAVSGVAGFEDIAIGSFKSKQEREIASHADVRPLTNGYGDARAVMHDSSQWAQLLSRVLGNSSANHASRESCCPPAPCAAPVLLSLLQGLCSVRSLALGHHENFELAVAKFAAISSVRGAGCNMCECLDLEGCTKLGKAALLDIMRAFPALAELRLRHCSQFHAQDVERAICTARVTGPRNDTDPAAYGVGTCHRPYLRVRLGAVVNEESGAAGNCLRSEPLHASSVLFPARRARDCGRRFDKGGAAGSRLNIDRNVGSVRQAMEPAAEMTTCLRRRQQPFGFGPEHGWELRLARDAYTVRRAKEHASAQSMQRCYRRFRASPPTVRYLIIKQREHAELVTIRLQAGVRRMLAQRRARELRRRNAAACCMQRMARCAAWRRGVRALLFDEVQRQERVRIALRARAEWASACMLQRWMRKLQWERSTPEGAEDLRRREASKHLLRVKRETKRNRELFSGEVLPQLVHTQHTRRQWAGALLVARRAPVPRPSSSLQDVPARTAAPPHVIGRMAVCAVCMERRPKVWCYNCRNVMCADCEQRVHYGRAAEGLANHAAHTLHRPALQSLDLGYHRTVLLPSTRSNRPFADGRVSYASAAVPIRDAAWGSRGRPEDEAEVGGPTSGLRGLLQDGRATMHRILATTATARQALSLKKRVMKELVEVSERRTLIAEKREREKAEMHQNMLRRAAQLVQDKYRARFHEKRAAKSQRNALKEATIAYKKLLEQSATRIQAWYRAREPRTLWLEVWVENGRASVSTPEALADMREKVFDKFAETFEKALERGVQRSLADIPLLRERFCSFHARVQHTICVAAKRYRAAREKRDAEANATKSKIAAEAAAFEAGRRCDKGPRVQHAQRLLQLQLDFYSAMAGLNAQMLRMMLYHSSALMSERFDETWERRLSSIELRFAVDGASEEKEAGGDVAPTKLCKWFADTGQGANGITREAKRLAQLAAHDNLCVAHLKLAAREIRTWTKLEEMFDKRRQALEAEPCRSDYHLSSNTRLAQLAQEESFGGAVDSRIRECEIVELDWVIAKLDVIPAEDAAWREDQATLAALTKQRWNNECDFDEARADIFEKADTCFRSLRSYRVELLSIAELKSELQMEQALRGDARFCGAQLKDGTDPIENKLLSLLRQESRIRGAVARRIDELHELEASLRERTDKLDHARRKNIEMRRGIRDAAKDDKDTSERTGRRGTGPEGPNRDGATTVVANSVARGCVDHRNATKTAYYYEASLPITVLQKHTISGKAMVREYEGCTWTASLPTGFFKPAHLHMQQELMQLRKDELLRRKVEQQEEERRIEEARKKAEQDEIARKKRIEAERKAVESAQGKVVAGLLDKYSERPPTLSVRKKLSNWWNAGKREQERLEKPVSILRGCLTLTFA